jgi:molybdopterin biosynthesis enzyme
VLATFTRFVLPALCKAEGGARVPMQVSLQEVKALPRFSRVLPVCLDASGTLIPQPPKNSGDYVSVAATVGIVEIPSEDGCVPGQSFPFYPFP